MTHWGWYWKVKKKHKARGLCDYRSCIDSFELFKLNDFSGFTVKKGEKVVAVATLKGEFLAIKGEQICYNIPVESQSCNFGGYRYFFRCPVPSCNKRMRKLYSYQDVFACRKCFNLAYRSQGVVSSYRFWLMEKKITEKLKNLGGSEYRKPKGMRWKTFERLKAKANDFSWKSEAALFEEFYQMYGSYP